MSILLESGDGLLLESGDPLLAESGADPDPVDDRDIPTVIICEIEDD